MAEPDKRHGVFPLIESPITWGGMGVLIGAVAAVAPVPALRYLFVFTWVIFVFALIRHNVFTGRRLAIQIMGNTMLSVIIAAGLICLLRAIPPPKDFPTAAEIAAAQHYPTAAEIAQELSKIGPRSSPAQKTLVPAIKIIFKDSPLFTKARKQNITKAINEAYMYLSTLGFPLERELPPLGVSLSNVQSMSGIFPGTIYERHFNLPHDSLDDSNAVRQVYLSYVFRTIFHVFGPDALSPPDAETRTIVATLFEVYYASSIAGKNLDSSDWKGHRWMQALWEIRQTQGREATDQYMLYTYKAWNDSAGPSDFDHVFVTRFMAGVWVKDNNGTSIAVVNPILGKYKLFMQP